MRGPRERIDRGADRMQGRLDQGLFAPAAIDAFFRKGDIGIVIQRLADFVVGFRIGTAVEMDRHEVARGGQTLGLEDYRIGVFMTQKDEGNFCHLEIGTKLAVTLCQVLLHNLRNC